MLKKIYSHLINTKKLNKSAFWIQRDNQKSIENELNEIPSETSLRERLFLYWLARNITLKGKILEVGPFLGGTTRALAKGLHENLFLKDKEILTIDRFEGYYTAEKIRQMKVPLDTNIADKKKIDFYTIFCSYLDSKPYQKLVTPIKAAIPDSKDYYFPNIELNKHYYSIVLIDGCKSWYSIKSLFLEIVNSLKISSYLIFQDYGRFTCFWIPLFCKQIQDHIIYEGSIDSTRSYRLKKKINYSKLKKIFPDEPFEFEEKYVEKVFDELIEKEIEHSKKVILRIQFCAFLAYINKKEKAKFLLLELKKDQLNTKRDKKNIQEAVFSPTYTSGGEAILL